MTRLIGGDLLGVRATKTPVHIQVLTALRFFSEGNYQKGVGQDYFHPSSQTNVSRIIEKVVDALIAVSHHFIKFPNTKEERQEVASG